MALDFPYPAYAGNTYVGSNGVTYTFDGTKWVVTTSPISGNITFDGNTIGTNNNGNILIHPYGQTWVFSTDGTIVFPNGSIQSTAYVSSNTGNYIFDNDYVYMPDAARLNSGGVGTTGSAEFGTSVSKDGPTIVSGETYMGSGAGEFRSIYNYIDDTESTLTYSGVENVGIGKFSGVVSQTPYMNSQYTIGVDTNGNITIGAAQQEGSQTSNDWSTGLGTANENLTINGIFTNTTQTVLAGGDGYNTGKIRLYDQGVSITANNNTTLFASDGAIELPQGGLITETAGSLTITPADFGGAENTAWYSIFGDQKIPRTGNVDYGASTAYDSTGNLYVIGGHVDTSNYTTGDNIALKYDQYGNLLFRKAWTTPEGMPCGSVHSALKIDRSTDTIYWASTEISFDFQTAISYVGVMDTELNIPTAPLMIRNIEIQEIQINEPGILTVGGSYTDRILSLNFPVLAKINLNTNQLLWMARADASGITEYGGIINSIAIDGLGNTWAVGSCQPTTSYYVNKPFLARFDSNGVKTGFWNIASFEDNNYNIEGVAVAINSGYLYTLINDFGPSGVSVIAKWDISSDPTRIWMQAIDIYGGTFANNMQFDDAGSLYLVGQTYDVPSNTNFYVAKIDPGNGSVIWQRTFGSADGGEGDAIIGFRAKYIDVFDYNIAWSGATATNPLDPSNYYHEYVITLQIPTDGSLTGQLGLFNYTEVDFSFTQPVGYDILAVSANFNMISTTVSTNTMIADSVLKSRRYIPYRYDLVNNNIIQPYNWTFSDNGSTTMPNFSISGNLQNGGASLGDEGQFLLLDASGTVVLQSRYNSGTPVVIQGANCPDGGMAGDVHINAGHSSVPSTDGDTRQGNVFVTAGPGAVWQFDSNSGLTFPDTSVQMTAWQGNAAIVSDTAPVAEYGAVWFNTIDARTYVNYNGTWVDANPTVLPPPSTYVGNLDIEGASITSVTIGEPVEINGWQFNDDSTVTASGDLVPDADSIYSLGSAGRQWKDLYVSNTTIYVGGTPVSVVDGSLTVGGNVVSGNASGTSVEFPNGSYIRQINEEGIRIWQTDVGGDNNDAEYVALQYGGDPDRDNANVSITAGRYNWAIDDNNLTFFNYYVNRTGAGRRQINFDIRSSETDRLLNWHLDETGNIYLPADPSVASTSGIVFADGTLQTTASTSYTLPTANASVLGGVKLGDGFSTDNDNKVTTNKLYSTNATQPDQHYRLELDTNGVVVLPDQSIINGSTLRGIYGTGEANYTGITIGPNAAHREESWMYVDHTGSYIATQYNTDQKLWQFKNDGSTVLPSGAGFARGDSGQIKTSGDTLTLDLRDASGRGFYTNGDGLSLRGNSSNTWLFGSNGSLTLPGNIVSNNQSIKFSSNITDHTSYTVTNNLIQFGNASNSAVTWDILSNNYSTGFTNTKLTVPTSTANTNTYISFSSPSNNTILQSSDLINQMPGGRPGFNIIASNTINLVTNPDSGSHAGGASIGYGWTFGSDGTLIVPGEIKSIAGTGPVTIQSNDGNNTYTWNFGTDGTLTLPTCGGSGADNEGAEIDFTKAVNSTLSGNSVVVDQYIDRLRFFESGGTSRGAYIDLKQAAAGVGTLLNNRISAFVNAGTFVTMDNIKATVTTSNQRGLSLATVSGTATCFISGTYGMFGGATVGGSSAGIALTTTPSVSIFSWDFGSEGDTATYILNDGYTKSYRITMMIGGAYTNNMISIERLI